jgi:hypothetical protein
MLPTFGVQILALLLAAPAAQLDPGLPRESAQSQADQQTGSSVDHPTPTGPKAVPGSKYCPPSADSASVKSANCASEPSHKRKRPPPSRTGEAPAGEPTKTVVRNGGTSDTKVAISPGMSDQQASQKLQKTNRLLSSTDANLKQIEPRQLSASQQDTVKQIKSYVDQAKEAANKGDVESAYNLASKASMLSADLVGPRR